MSAVNVAELYSKLTLWRTHSVEELEILLGGLSRIEPFTPVQAKVAGELIAKTSQHGLSIGDRACLALALDLGGEVYTTDRAWSNVNVGCQVHLMR